MWLNDTSMAYLDIKSIESIRSLTEGTPKLIIGFKSGREMHIQYEETLVCLEDIRKLRTELRGINRE